MDALRTRVVAIFVAVAAVCLWALELLLLYQLRRSQMAFQDFDSTSDAEGNLKFLRSLADSASFNLKVIGVLLPCVTSWSSSFPAFRG